MFPLNCLHQKAQDPLVGLSACSSFCPSRLKQGHWGNVEAAACQSKPEQMYHYECQKFHPFLRIEYGKKLQPLNMAE